MTEIKMGMTVQDKITNFSGIVTGKCQYISGCDQALVIPRVKEDGSYKDGQWFDIQRLVVVSAPEIKLDNGDTPGCDMQAPIK